MRQMDLRLLLLLLRGNSFMPLARQSKRTQEQYHRRFHYPDPRLFDHADLLILRDCGIGLTAYGANHGIRLRL